MLTSFPPDEKKLVWLESSVPAVFAAGHPDQDNEVLHFPGFFHSDSYNT